MFREKGRFLEPKSPSRQKAGQRAGIEKETEGVTLVCTRPAPRKLFHGGCEFSIDLRKESSGERHLSLLRRAERLSPGRRPAARPSPELPREAVGQGPDRGVRRPPYRGRPHSRQRTVCRVRPPPRGWRTRKRLSGLRDLSLIHISEP